MKTLEAIGFLKSGDKIKENQFEILRAISDEINKDTESHISKELLLRALENKKYFSETAPILQSLVRQIGLFPYLDSEKLSLKETIAYEYHRPQNLGDIVFHQEQLSIYFKLLAGKNVVLSAPTSFGKSKIIDAIIADQIYDNIVIVVPTLALIDETRRRLTEQFSHLYNVIAHPSQKIVEGKNLFIFTPERVVAYKNDFPKIDFFVIDEFYKIGGQSEEDKRVIALNEAFYHLYKKHKAQFYMLGPNIKMISEGAGKKFNFEFISTDYDTVISEVNPIHLSTKDQRIEKLVETCSKITQSTLIYCKSIPQVYEVAEELLNRNIGLSEPECYEIADWLSLEFHPEWVLPKALYNGIGLHYGPLPRSIAKEMVRLFNEEKIRFLICTSTLIEGVNTKAKNVIIYENKIARQKLDYFTFNNIKGRSGRMFEHFIGRVFTFDDEPQQELPFVDFPLYSQDENTPESLLIQLDEEDLSNRSIEKVKKRATNSPLPIWVLQDNHGIDPDDQIAVYNQIVEDMRYMHPQLSWTRMPKYDQLQTCCKLIWENWVGSNKNEVYSYKQLTFRIWNIKAKQRLSERISNELVGEYAAKDANDAVKRILSFDRNWVGFDFPQYLLALHRIQEYIFQKNKLKPGDYSYFAKQVESFFLPEVCIALDEFGVPINLSQKCAFLNQANDLTEAINILRDFDISSLRLHPYEITLLENAKKGI
ncbi:MAG: DEAD/DEAH box helicase [Tissierellales bacterium]|nr:DEAD/DEAH box helicase [Tissierellales bacterium]